MEQQGHEEETGKAKITPAFNLPCRYVLHTVGPIVGGRLTKDDENLLASCYLSCLELAEQNSIKSIAEGRVWDGGNALKIGLIDQFGGISEAVSWVAQKAKLTQTDYTIDYYPEYTPDIINLIYNSLGSSIQSKHLYFNGEDITNTINRIQKILDTDRIQCRMENIYIR